MLIRATLILFVLFFTKTVYADELFRKCNDVLNKPEYKVLNEQLVNEKVQADYCQRLNNDEFLYTTYRNFYYCNFKSKNSPVCEENEDGIWYPNLNIATSFTGENSKQFVLFNTSRLAHGVFSSGHQIFFFVPKDVSPRGYKIINLKGAGEYNGLPSDAGELCSNLSEGEEALENIDKEYEIINKGKANVGVRFIYKVSSCASKTVSIQTLEYTWSGKDFIQTKNEVKKQ